MPIEYNDVAAVVNDLRTVRTFGEFPKGRNWLFSRYKSLGYVTMTHKTVGTGKNKRLLITERSKVRLTKKGYAALKVSKEII